MKIEYESLLYRIKENPIEHLGRHSVTEIRSYFMGYEMARDFWQQPKIHYRLSPDKFRGWIESKVHLCNKNLESFCLLLTEDESQAMNLYFEFYELALEEFRLDLKSEAIAPNRKDFDETIKSDTLVNFISGEHIKTRPAMYFGNHRWLSSLWAMCSGFLWAEKDLGVENSSDAMNMELFQHWLEERYPFAEGRPWDRIFYFLGLNSNRMALDAFYEHFEMFLKGDKPDETSKTIKTIVENALKHLKEKENNE